MRPEGRPIRHLRTPRRVDFPVEAEMPETKRHLELRTALYDVLKHALAREASIGSEQFVYWNARDPGRALAPDAFVKLGVPDTAFSVWKTWERGTPEVAVEILSESDERLATWEAKLERYHELGIRELVAFDAGAEAGARLRVWDRIDDNLVEREVEGDSAASGPLGLYWVVAAIDAADVALRLARDAAGRDLLPTAREAAEQAREQEARAREAETRAREQEARAREAAERRVTELEAELARRRS